MTDADWTLPTKGYYRRDFRLAEWLAAPISPSFATWAVPQIERGFSDAAEASLSMSLVLPAHVIVNGWFFTSDPKAKGMVRALRRHPRLLASTFIAMMSMATRPDRGERAMAQPTLDLYRSDLFPAHQQRVAAAAERVAEVEPTELVGIVDDLTHSTGTLMFAMVQTMGFAGKAEFALATFYAEHLRPVRGGSHLELLGGLTEPAPLPEQAVLSLDWIEPTLGEMRRAGDARPGVEALRARRIEAEAACREVLAGDEGRLARFDEMLAIAQRWGPIREELASDFTLAWPSLRIALARIGGELAGRGVITSPIDVFLLDRSQIEAALGGDGSSLAASVEERRRQRESDAGLSVPLELGKATGPWRKIDQYLSVFRSSSSGATTPLVMGIPTSTGVATGRVRVVRDLDDFDDFEPGEVLVAPMTAPAWTPLFALAAAVVTDTGSPFAHASVVAREFGIPAIVGTGDATIRLVTGQMVTVDGMRGAVDLA